MKNEEQSNNEYAEKAVEANKKGKLLVINDKNELELVDIVSTQVDILYENEIKKAELMDEAVNKISLLHDAIDLDIQQDGDEDLLLEWKKYRVLLSRVDTSVENVEFPQKPV